MEELLGLFEDGSLVYLLNKFATSPQANPTFKGTKTFLISRGAFKVYLAQYTNLMLSVLLRELRPLWLSSVKEHCHLEVGC